MRLGLRPTALVLGQARFTRVLDIHDVNYRQVHLTVINRPMHLKMAAIIVVLDPNSRRIIARPKHAAFRKLFVIQPLRQRILQLRRYRLLAHNRAHHLILQRINRRHRRQMRPRLKRIIGHLQQFLIDRKAALDTVKCQLSRMGITPREMILMRQRLKRQVQPQQIPRQHIRIASRQTPLGLHRGRDLGHMLRDPLELAKIPAGDAGIFQLEVVEGMVSRHRNLLPRHQTRHHRFRCGQN